MGRGQRDNQLAINRRRRNQVKAMLGESEKPYSDIIALIDDQQRRQDTNAAKTWT